MGYSRKEEIARLRQQQREAKASKKRKENVREKLVRFLIVCEGTKTEPHYFEALHTGTDYAMHKPCTMVDKLVVELEHPEVLLENRI